jgi:4-hydroxy-tetrahydrodipicolinate reductase
MATTNLVVNGGAGRMGKLLIRLAVLDPQFRVAAALEHANHPDLGKDAGTVAGVEPIGVPLSTEMSDADIDVIIDFSVPEAAELITHSARQRALPLVMATTGLNESQRKHLAAAAESIPIVWAPNMSLAVNLVMKLTGTTADVLRNYPGGTDVEILERHHRFKEDAPSGTALQFGKIIADSMGQTRHVHGRTGRPGQRPPDEIAYHALRVGDNPGEHTIVFSRLGETIELTVRATNRNGYATGALAAAKFLVGKPAGLYDMFDVLGL